MALSAKCLQFLLFLFDGIFFISAFAVVILNCMFLYKILSYSSFIDTNIILPCILLLVVGIISLFFAWVGWKSAWHLHRLHIILFGVSLLLIVLAQLGFSIWSLVIWDNMHEKIVSAVEVDFRVMTNKTETDDVIIKRWDKIQSELQCCGIGGPSDYRAAKTIPWSCCTGSSATSALVGDCGTIYQRGCVEPVYQVARDVMLYVCLTALGAGLIQALGLVCTYYLQAAVGRPSAIEVRRQSSVVASSSSTRRPAPQPPKGSSATKSLLSTEGDRY